MQYMNESARATNKIPVASGEVPQVVLWASQQVPLATRHELIEHRLEEASDNVSICLYLKVNLSEIEEKQIYKHVGNTFPNAQSAESKKARSWSWRYNKFFQALLNKHDREK